jgi:hypothetical protein
VKNHPRHRRVGGVEERGVQATSPSTSRRSGGASPGRRRATSPSTSRRSERRSTSPLSSRSARIRSRDTGPEFGPPGQDVEIGPAPRGPAPTTRTFRNNGGPEGSLVAAGDKTSFAIGPYDGRVFAWGHGQYGQLGFPGTEGEIICYPREVRFPAPCVVVGVSSGPFHTAFVTASGAVFMCGVGNRREIPAMTKVVRARNYLPDGREGQVEMPPVTSVAAWQEHALFLLVDGRVAISGVNGDGQLGIPHGSGVTSIPTILPDINNAVAVAAGLHHSLAVLADGRVLSWGQGERGRLGHGDHANQRIPKVVEGLNGIVGCAAGRVWSAVLSADWRVFTFGSFTARSWNTQTGRLAWAAGWLGRSPAVGTDDQLQPFLVEDLHNVSGIAGRGDHLILRFMDGRVGTLGTGWSGELGCLDPRAVYEPITHLPRIFPPETFQ